MTKREKQKRGFYFAGSLPKWLWHILLSKPKPGGWNNIEVSRVCVGIQGFGPHFAVFPSALVQRWLRNGTTSAWTGTPIWNSRFSDGGLTHCAITRLSGLNDRYFLRVAEAVWQKDSSVGHKVWHILFISWWPLSSCTHLRVLIRITEMLGEHH